MAATDWEEIYGTYSDSELADEIAFLKAESRSMYISQSQGSKSFTRSLSDISARLTAAIRVRELKTGKQMRGRVDSTVVDFS